MEAISNVLGRGAVLRTSANLAGAIENVLVDWFIKGILLYKNTPLAGRLWDIFLATCPAANIFKLRLVFNDDPIV